MERQVFNRQDGQVEGWTDKTDGHMSNYIVQIDEQITIDRWIYNHVQRQFN